MISLSLRMSLYKTKNVNFEFWQWQSIMKMFMWCLGECKPYTDVVNFSGKQDATHIFIMRSGNPSPTNIIIFSRENYSKRNDTRFPHENLFKCTAVLIMIVRSYSKKLLNQKNLNCILNFYLYTKRAPTALTKEASLWRITNFLDKEVTDRDY